MRSTGWLTRWGEPMANTSLPQFITTLDGVLDYNDGTGSVNLYMAHGGTNFGYSAGAQPGPAMVLTCHICPRISKHQCRDGTAFFPQ